MEEYSRFSPGTVVLSTAWQSSRGFCSPDLFGICNDSSTPCAKAAIDLPKSVAIPVGAVEVVNENDGDCLFFRGQEYFRCTGTSGIGHLLRAGSGTDVNWYPPHPDSYGSSAGPTM